MQLYSYNRRKRFIYRITISFLTAVFVFCALGAAPIQASADSLSTFTVTTAADSGTGSLRWAITQANTDGNDFKIIIAVESPLITATALPVLTVYGRSGCIEGNPKAVLTGFSCEIKGGGKLTLNTVSVDNSAYDLAAIIVSDNSSDNTLMLSGNNRIVGSPAGYDQNIEVYGALTVDKAPGGSDLNSILALSDTDTGVRGTGTLRVKGGTLESIGAVYGTDVWGWLLVTGGRLIASGGADGICNGSSYPYYGGSSISGGTIVARGSALDINTEINMLTISGGSVNARKFSIPPEDADGNPVYLVTVTAGITPVINTEVSCSVNGGVPFTSITDEQGKLYLWMPVGQGGAEINVNGIIYRASGTVENNYENVMLAKADPVITEVVVIPSSVTAVSGTSVQFSVRVEGQYNPPQNVTWNVKNAHQGTTIDGIGLLTISKNESSRSLLVTATSTYDMDKSGTAQVNVISAIAILLIVVLPLLLLLLLVIFSEVGIPFRQRR